MISAFSIPILGLGVLLLGLWHSGPTDPGPQADAATRVYLLDPDVRMDKSLTVCLRQQAKEVALCRERLRAAKRSGRHLTAAEVRWRRQGLTQAVADYNLVARECTPAVFQKTGMPSALTF